jgi:acyl-CoA thioesterase FadM
MDVFFSHPARVRDPYQPETARQETRLSWVAGKTLKQYLKELPMSQGLLQRCRILSLQRTRLRLGYPLSPGQKVRVIL